jgi:hypothetical protein
LPGLTRATVATGRMARALRVQLHLDDDAIEALKDELI